MKKLNWIFLVIGLWLILEESAYAYLDPGSGSMILQIVLGGLAGAALVIKTFWHRIVTFFKIRKDEPKSEETIKED